jgi:hypothetical protein
MRLKAAYVAHTEEHVASADKRLSGVFFGPKFHPQNSPRDPYSAGTLSC